MIVRSKFTVEYDLPAELQLKQAETEDEIRQALTLVHDSYVELGYMDPVEMRLRFSKYLALPTTVILIAKWNDEVVGTISIIADSALGLPSESSWPIHSIRNQGLLIAEISSLAIKKDYRMRRGKLLLPLCKLMYRYCLDILKLDGIIASTTTEVEAFYTDVLLFKTLKQAKGFKHDLVKGNPSICCFLPVGKQWENLFVKAYGNKPIEKNLHHFFAVAETPQIKLPKNKISLQSFFNEKNAALTSLIKNEASLLQDLSARDTLILQNLRSDNKVRFSKDRNRLDVRLEAWVFLKSTEPPIKAQILNISSSGLQLRLLNIKLQNLINQELLLVYEHQGQMNACQMKVVWQEYPSRLGCHILDKLDLWTKMNEEIWIEFDEVKAAS